ncbi:MAG: tRNA (N(6)-L-threonylcarbamoyladenosine(37)-C(2))-methylthiotransferase MtaB [Clostridia bacterium]|nr:tRNA (N(6)-L-threonylcarbamoyladenosine(37)-C(2))-methylthiotransferase MtaB [Clostridia bacterium]MBQ3006536.1 tRNA (N(6)-L-threonylcarbamoyladenosine(37)-C(2))-methylthiotransferase MtaB [Clostridia bacterium]
MKAAFYTLGCKVNQYESQAMAQNLEKHGFIITDHNEEADVYVINSCTVTAESDRKTRQAVRRFKKQHPESIVILTGCMPQAFPEYGKKLDEADIVIGNKSNRFLHDYINQYINGSGRIFAVDLHKTGDEFSGDTISSFRERTRASVKIEDGCNRFCSYCIIPYARGRVRSKPLDELKNEIAELEKNGFSEIVLVGINLSAYGMGTDTNIVDAVKLAASFDGIKRVRLGSLEPDHITDEIIEGLAEIPEFCPQFHISLQSGCDSTLKRMNRHYNSTEYYELCKKLRSSFTDTTITTDIMVGFPGETEEDFEKSLKFAVKVGFEKVHVFPYSIRPGTPAAKMEGQIEKSEKERRAAIMSSTCEEIRQNFLKSQVGKTLEVLVEEHHGGFAQGYTANYTPVKIPCTCELSGIIKAEITDVDGDFCVGKI